MIDTPDDVTAGYVCPPVVRRSRQAVVIRLPDWQWAGARGREEIGQTEPGQFDRSPGEEGVATHTVPESRLPLDDEHGESRSGQDGAEGRAGDTAADHDDIKE
jgi:hypothetical protein